MSKAYYSESGLAVFGDNGIAAMQDDCPCGCPYTSVFDLPTPDYVVAVGSSLPDGLPPSTPLYASLTACFAAINETNRDQIEIYVNGGSHSDIITKASEKNYVMIGVGNVSWTGDFSQDKGYSKCSFKNINVNCTTEYVYWYSYFIDCDVDIVADVYKKYSIHGRGNIGFSGFLRCNVNIKTMDGTFIQETEEDSKCYNSGSISIVHVESSVVSLKTGNGGMQNQTWAIGFEKTGGSSGGISVSHVCNSIFTNLQTGNGSDGGDGYEFEDLHWTAGGDGGGSGSIRIGGYPLDNYYTIYNDCAVSNATIGSGGDGGDGSNVTNNYVGKSGGTGGTVGDVLLYGAAKSNINIVNVEFGTCGNGGDSGIGGDGYSLHGGSGGNFRGFGLYTLGAATINCDIVLPDGGNGGVNTGIVYTTSYHYYKFYPNSSGGGVVGGIYSADEGIKLQGNIEVLGDIIGGNGGDGSAATLRVAEWRGAYGGDGANIFLTNDVIVHGDIIAGNGGNGSTGNVNTTGGWGGKGGSITEENATRGTLGVGGTGGTGSLGDGADGADGEYLP